MDKFTDEELTELREVLCKDGIIYYEELLKFIKDQEMRDEITRAMNGELDDDQLYELNQKFLIEVFSAMPKDKLNDLIDNINIDFLVDGYEKKLSKAFPQTFFRVSEYAARELPEEIENLFYSTDSEALANNLSSIKDYASESIDYKTKEQYKKYFMDEIWNRIDDKRKLELFQDYGKYIISSLDNIKDNWLLTEIMRNMPQEMLGISCKNIFDYCKENNITVNDNNFDTLTYILQNSPKEIQTYGAKTIINGITADILNMLFGSKIHTLLKSLDTDKKNEILYENLDIIFDDIIQNAFVYDDILNDLPKELQEKLLKLSLENTEKFSNKPLTQGPYIFQVIFNHLDNETVLEHENEIKEIVGKLSKDTMQSYGVIKILEEIEICKNPKKAIEDFSKLDIIELADEKKVFKYRRMLKQIFENEENPLIDIDSVSCLYQLVNHGLWGNNLIINKIIKEEMNKFQTPDMSKYEENVSNLTDMDEKTFDEFIEDIKKYKLANGIIPEEYCDYLIKQKFKPDSILNKNIDKYFNVFKRCFEDKNHHLLEKKGIYSNYIVLVSDSLDPKLLGVTGYNYVVYKDEEIKNLGVKNMEAIDTMFHETQHILQKKHIFLKEKMNSVEYKMLKESIIRQKSENYYTDNYIKMFNEIDARMAGMKGAYNYLKQLGLENEEILDMEGRNFFETYIDNYKIELSIQESAALKKNSKGDVERNEDTFFEILKNNPNLLEKYPILKLEYTEEGKRKGSFEILDEFEQELDKIKKGELKVEDSNIHVLSEILKRKGNYFGLKNLWDDSKKLLEYETDNPVIKSYINIIIKNEFIEFLPVMQYICEEEKEKNSKIANHYEKIMQRLQDYADRNPDEEISKEIYKGLKIKREEKEKENNSDIQALSNIDSMVKPEERREGNSVIGSMAKVQKEDIRDNSEKVS